MDCEHYQLKESCTNLIQCTDCIKQWIKLKGIWVQKYSGHLCKYCFKRVCSEKCQIDRMGAVHKKVMENKDKSYPT